jgi:protein involved in polysaccharide export with SLBB domain
MRDGRLLIVVLAALAMAGCLRREAPMPYQYVYAPAAAATPEVPAAYRPAQSYPVAQAYPQPAYRAQAAIPTARTPTPRGLFADGGPLARGMASSRRPGYAAPGYSAPGYALAASSAPCGTAGCATPGYPAASAPMPASAQPGYAYGYPPQAGYLQGYALDAGDRLRITVFGQQGLTNSYAVDAAGHITMPLVGSIPARGLSTEQLGQSISERLRQGYIREPQVAIEIEAYRPFFIHGEVAIPGQYPYVANMTVENAIAIAGGFAARADKSKVALSRTMNGQTTKATVGLNYPLRPGDTLRIGERWF